MNSRERSLLVGLVLAEIGSALLVGWFMGDHSPREWLLSFAGSAEFFGLLLVASPELVPLVTAAFSRIVSGWAALIAFARSTLRWIADKLRRLLGLRRTHFGVVHASGTGGARVGGFSGSGRTSPGENATLEEKVEYLLDRDQSFRRIARRWTVGCGRCVVAG